MRKNLIHRKIVLSLGLLFISLYAHPQCDLTWVWGKQSETKIHTETDPRDLCVDQDGNIYTVGLNAINNMYYQGELITIGSQFVQGYLMKVDKNGKLLWHKAYNGPYSVYVYAVDIDHEGNVYVCGFYESESLKLDSVTLYKTKTDSFYDRNDPKYKISKYNCFLIKYDPNGKIIWVRSNLTGNAEMDDLSIDNENNVCVTGRMCSGYIAFDKNHKVYERAGGAYPVMFTIKYDSDGNVKWVHDLKCPDCNSVKLPSVTIARAITTDHDGNVFVSGQQNGKLVIAGKILEVKSPNFEQYYIVKYDKDGNEIWGMASKIPQNVSSLIADLATDARGNLYAFGSTGQDDLATKFFIMGQDTFPFPDYPGIPLIMHLSKISPDGNFIWTIASEPTSTVLGNPYDFSLAIGPDENIFVGGLFPKDSLQFGNVKLYNPSPSNIYMVDANFIFKVSPNGNVEDGTSVPGLTVRRLSDLDVNENGDILVTGNFQTGGYLDSFLIIGKDSLSSPNIDNPMYIAKVRNAFSTTSLINQPKCSGDQNGSIAVNVFGGEKPYSINWSTNDTTQKIENLKQGQYIVSISDKNKCKIKDTFSLMDPPFMDVNITTTPDSTKKCIGTAKAIVSGGVPPYIYAWNDSKSQTTQTATNLCVGDYKLIVTDSNQCEKTVDFSIPESSSINEEKTLFTIYPNPSKSGVFYLKLPRDIQAKWSVFSAAGKEIGSDANTSFKKEYIIDLSGNENGIYYLRLNYNGIVYTKELINMR